MPQNEDLFRVFKTGKILTKFYKNYFLHLVRLISLPLFSSFASLKLTNIKKGNEDQNPDQEQVHYINLKLNTKTTFYISKIPTEFNYDPWNSLVIVLSDGTFIQTDKNSKTLMLRSRASRTYILISMRNEFYY